MTTLRPYLYAPLRACLRGPTNDARTVAVLAFPLDGEGLFMERAPLPSDADGRLVSEAREDILAELVEVWSRAHDVADVSRWWQARALCDADFVYLAAPMAGAAADVNGEVARILKDYIQS
ncbi:MAG: hypothetical protein FJ102_15175 [Deltaproteobacteria bacterium]|nr:hypothetical protein [Deltaproteobacteria bacterium]